MNALPLLNPEHVTDAEAATYKKRDSVRAIVLDQDGKMALLHATTYNYYKLPGGGVDEGESLHDALKRECLEEIGCNIEVDAEVGSLTEYRKKRSLNQVSYTYIAHVVGEKGEPHLEPGEAAHGFKTVWMTIADARAAVQSGTHSVYDASYMIARDTALIDAAQQKLDAKSST
jgi:ADP-ribose pyrophosphatase YjhB (NUDIX family)